LSEKWKELGSVTNAEEVRATLGEAEWAQRTTRRVKRSVWFPLAVFGALTMISAALCANDAIQPSNALSSFWLLAGPLGYAAVYAFYRRRELTVGVGDRNVAFVAAGIVLLLFTAQFAVDVHTYANGLSYSNLLSPATYLATWWFLAAAVAGLVVSLVVRRWGLAILAGFLVAASALLLSRAVLPEALFLGQSLLPNTLPVVVVALALLVLAGLQRSLWLGAVGLAVGGLAFLSGLYIIDNLFDALPHCGTDLLGIGVFMLVAAAGTGIVERARR
jgi:hypothetical protein